MFQYRTINKCFDMIYQDDNQTAITKFYIRKLCETNKVLYMKTGNKYLVDYDSLIAYLKNPTH